MVTWSTIAQKIQASEDDIVQRRNWANLKNFLADLTGSSSHTHTQSDLTDIGVSVTDINDPSTELNAIAGSNAGEFRVVYQSDAATDSYALYFWDDADSGSESVPDTVDGSSGMWVKLASGLDISGLTEEAGVDPDADMVPYYDASASGNRKATPRDLLPSSDTNLAGPSDVVFGTDPRLTNAREPLIDLLTAITTADTANDFVALWDASSKQVKKMTIDNLGTALTASLDIDGLTEETGIDPDADYLALYDSTAAANRKASPRDIIPVSDTNLAGPSDVVLGADPRLTNAREPLVDALPTITPDPAADFVPLYDTSGKKVGKALPNNLGIGGTDSDAIHDNVSAEISAITEKTTPVSADLLVIEDSAASNAKKRVQIGNLPGGSGDFIADLVTAEASITGTTTLDDTDMAVMHVCSGSSAYTITLPTMIQATGKFISFRFTNTATTTLVGQSAEAIGGMANRYYMANDFVALYCDGNRWHITSECLVPVGFKAYMASNYNASGSGVGNLSFDTEVYDWGSDYNTTTDTFTAPVTGWYRMGLSVKVDNAAGSTGACTFSLKHSGTTHDISGSHKPASGDFDHVMLTDAVQMDDGDTLSAEWVAAVGYSEFIEGGVGDSYFWAHRVASHVNS